MSSVSKATEACGYSAYTLKSGLTVLVRPMPGYSSVHAEFAARFGSVNDRFRLGEKVVELPEGVAHFLEHKMFESEECDAFSLYAKTGANANAYTSFDKTCYLFTATRQIDRSLDILLSMVGTPYFTEQTIAKEQGIIGQEIKMYDDNPDWRMLVALCDCLYHKHGVRSDIAGSVESIAQITPEMLYACTDAFYSPANMVLAVAGNVTEQQVLDACEREGLCEERPLPDSEPLWPDEPREIRIPRRRFAMSVARPCLGIAYKEQPHPMEDARRDILCEMVCEVVCGDMTPLYRRLYDEGLVNPGFGCECLSVPGCCMFMITGETDEPDRVEALLKEEIERLRTQGVDPELFSLCRNQMYGQFLKEQECVDDACSAMMSAALRRRTLEEEIRALATLTAEDLNEALKDMLRPERSAVVLIEPETPDREEEAEE